MTQVPNIFVNGTAADANEVNENFTHFDNIAGSEHINLYDSGTGSTSQQYIIKIVDGILYAEQV